MKATVRMRLGRDAVRATLESRGSVTWEAHSPYESLEELIDLIAALGEEPALARNRNVIVEVEPALCQVRTLRDMPPVKRSDLAALVSTQPARYFRRRQSDLIVDAAWNRPEGDVRTAAAVAVECEVVTAVLAGAEAGGFTVTAIKPSENFLPASLSLFPPAEERRRQRRRWMTVLRAALLVLAVWCAAAGVYAVDLAHDRDAIAAEVRRLAEPIAELAAAREEMRAVSVMVEAVTRAAAAQGWATELLASLTETIPESAYVLELSVDLHGAGRIEGFADSARDVVDAIASIDGVSSIESLVNPRLLSSDPLAGGLLPDDGKERFTVVFGPPFPNDTVSMARAFAGDTTVGRITP